MSKYLYQVSELCNNIKITLSENFPSVGVFGEICDINSNSKSGHIYFNIKDSISSISCVLWKNNATSFNHLLQDGLQIKIIGKIITFNNNSKIYLNAIFIEKYGLGDIQKNFLELKAKLTNEGLFNAQHKKDITLYPKSIGLITSKDGAVLSDITTTLSTRYPTKILLIDTFMQGEKSVDSIINAIEYFNSMDESTKPDFIIIARGGGAEEDLIQFNDEKLVRKAFESTIPIISAIGHDNDNSLLDLVADKFVSTPTASVAWLPYKSNLIDDIKYIEQNLQNNFSKYIKYIESKYSYLTKSLINPQKIISINYYKLNNTLKNLQLNMSSMLNQLTFKNKNLSKALLPPKRVIENKHASLQSLFSQLTNNLYILQHKQQKLDYLSNLLHQLSFKQTLSRGFNVIYKNNKLIKNANNLQDGNYTIEFYDNKKNIEIKIID